MNVGLVKTPAGTYRAGPTCVTVVSCTDVVRVEKVLTGFVIHTAVLDVAHFAHGRIDEAMAERDVARGSHAEQADSRAARIGFTDAGIQLLQRVADIGKSVLTALYGVVAIF